MLVLYMDVAQTVMVDRYANTGRGKVRHQITAHQAQRREVIN